MMTLLTVLAMCGLVGCNDIAWRMTRRTNHGIRVAVLLMGTGCILTLRGDINIALALLLAGIGLFHAVDRRDGYQVPKPSDLPKPFRTAAGFRERT